MIKTRFLRNEINFDHHHDDEISDSTCHHSFGDWSCCKTIPATAEKEIVPVYAMEGRMECSTKQGECVDDVQCNMANKSE